MSDGNDILNELENLIINASEGDKKALQQMLDKVESVPALPDDVASFISDNLELVLPEPQKVTSDDALRQLVLALAARSVDGLLLRDAIAALARADYSEYADPAGMIRAIAVLDQDTPIKEIYERFQMFAFLEEGAMVWHDSLGFGTVDEIDPFSGLVYISFSSKRNFGLEQALSNLSVVKPDSIVSKLRKKEEKFNRNVAAAEFDAAVSKSFVPPLMSPRQVVEALLIPDFLHQGEFIAWRDRSAAAQPKATDTPKEKVKKAAGPKVADSSVLPELPDPNDVISWENARSLQELKIELDKVKQVELHAGHVEHFLKLYKFASGRVNFANDFAITLIQLLEKAADREPVDQLIERLPKDAYVWSDPKIFVTVTTDLKAKQFDSWLHIAWLAQGKEWFLNNVMHLPFRVWSYAENTMKQEGEDVTELQQIALEKFRNRDCSADVVVWLWKQDLEEAADAFANPRLVFEALSHNVAGEFIKARKMLHNLLMNDEKFQAALMDGGSLDGIETLVKTTRAVKVIELGERQSLLVKIVRQFPEARPFVEEKKGAPARKKMPKTSSLRSVEAYRAELNDIINKQIPENAAAIGQARDYGDLRENFEFKAAKERQRLLSARRKELEQMLGEIIPTDFSEVELEDRVVPGCAVTLDTPEGEKTYYLLGLWDSDPDKQIISYDTPLGRALIGQELGTTVDLPQGHQAEIASIDELPEEIREWVKAPQ